MFWKRKKNSKTTDSSFSKKIATGIVSFKYYISQKYDVVRTKLVQSISYFMNEYDVKEKIKDLFLLGINVVVTGLAIWYVLNFRNFLSYGIATAVATYYISWLIKEIKAK